MPTYILLSTLTPSGRSKALTHPEFISQAETTLKIPGVQVLGQYYVLGEYDLVSIVEANDNQALARFSLELGVAMDSNIQTLSVIPVGRFEPSEGIAQGEESFHQTQTPPTQSETIND
jgi:uncharacterized protein with GYD domain